MTRDQILSKLKLYLKELQKNQVLPDDYDVNTSLLSGKPAVIDLLWRLVCFDILFLWDRIGYLSNQSTDVLVKVPFTVRFIHS